jgi:ferredoxin
MYRITLDKTACEGIFACLVRDDRFVEDADGLAAIEANDDTTTAATFDDDQYDAAAAAADACPVDAIAVEQLAEAGVAAEQPPEERT